jgi:hypothetical protein
VELIQARLANPAISAWLLVACLGVVVSLIGLAIMRYEIGLRPRALDNPTVRAMKRANRLAELVRAIVELLALGIGVAYVVGGVSGALVVWALVAINAGMVANSTNELLLTVHNIGGWRVVLRGVLGRNRPGDGP